MVMFLLLAFACVVVLVGVVLVVRSRGRVLRADDLGTISEGWLAEQRAASYELHR